MSSYRLYRHTLYPVIEGQTRSRYGGWIDDYAYAWVGEDTSVLYVGSTRLINSIPQYTHEFPLRITISVNNGEHAYFQTVKWRSRPYIKTVPRAKLIKYWVLQNIEHA